MNEWRYGPAGNLVAGLILGTVLGLCFAGMAHADTSPETISSEFGCLKVKMCVAETDTGTCERGTVSDEIVIELGFKSNLTFYSDQGEGAYSCDMVTNSEGHDAASGVGKQINVTPLTTSDPVISLVGLFDFLWIECSAVGTQTTVVLLACPAAR